MKTPFKFGKIAEGPAFTNREIEVEKLTQNFLNDINTILISPRRWGKSSLVKKVAQGFVRNHKDYKFCFIDLFRIANETEFYESLTKEVIKASSDKWQEWIETAKKLLYNLTPNISIGAAPDSDFKVSFQFQEPDISFEEILNLPEKIAKNKKIRIVICVDEFQNLSKFENPVQFQKKLRSVWQHHQHVTYCLYGSKRGVMMNLFENKSMPFYKFGDVIYLQKISEGDWLKFIRSAFKRTGKNIDQHFTEQIIELMQCHPYYVQQLSYLIWINTVNNVTEKIMKDSLEDLLSQNSLLFEKEVEALSAIQLNYLKALASGVTKQFSSKEIINRYNLGTSGNVVKIQKKLERQEIIDKTGDKICFNDPVFGLWLKERFELDDYP